MSGHPAADPAAARPARRAALNQQIWPAPPIGMSGTYPAKLNPRTRNGGDSQICFLVRNDARKSDVAFQTCDGTCGPDYGYGGSAHLSGTDSLDDGPDARLQKPATTAHSRPHHGGGWPRRPSNNEYPTIRYGEQNGFRRQLYYQGASIPNSASRSCRAQPQPADPPLTAANLEGCDANE